MTLTDTAQLMGNFGEFFGAIAVVATLGYLVMQIRQASRATMFSSEQRRSEATMNLVFEIPDCFKNHFVASLPSDPIRNFRFWP